MKKIFVLLVVIEMALSVWASASFAQGRAKTGPDPATIRDAELEKDSLHNLEVARHYFKQKTKVVVPDSMLAKEKHDMKYKTPEELREDARVYLSRLVADYPNSVFRSQAASDLRALGEPTQPAAAKPPQ